MHHDPYFVLADFDDYLHTQQKVSEAFSQGEEWTIKSIRNVARIGYYSADRAIRAYCDNVWNVKYKIKRMGKIYPIAAQINPSPAIIRPANILIPQVRGYSDSCSKSLALGDFGDALKINQKYKSLNFNGYISKLWV